LAIVSSVRDHPLPAEMVALGEIGLSGELRGVGQLEQRVREAAKLGFSSALVPQSAAQRLPRNLGLAAIPVATLRDALRTLGL
jgi:DNA repair protein RadA/Sms